MTHTGALGLFLLQQEIKEMLMLIFTVFAMLTLWFHHTTCRLRLELTKSSVKVFFEKKKKFRVAVVVLTMMSAAFCVLPDRRTLIQIK